MDSERVIHTAQSTNDASQRVHKVFLPGYVNSFQYEGARCHFYHTRDATIKAIEAPKSVEIVLCPDSQSLRDRVRNALRNDNLLREGITTASKRYRREDHREELRFLADKRNRVQEYGNQHGTRIAWREERGYPSLMNDIYHIKGQTVHIRGSSDRNEDVPKELDVIVFGIGKGPQELLEILHEL